MGQQTTTAQTARAAAQVWTITQQSDGEMLPWVGIFGSQEQAQAAIAAYLDDIWGEEPEMGASAELTWGKWETGEANQGRLWGWEDGSEPDTDAWCLVRHA